MNQRLGLIPLQFPRVVLIPLEIPVLQYCPINFIKIVHIIIEFRAYKGCMSISEEECPPRFMKSWKTGYEYYHLFIRNPCDTSEARFYVEHHRRIGGEVEGNVITQCATRLYGYGSAPTLVNKFGITNRAVVRVLNRGIATAHAMAENPGNIVPVGNTENKRFIGIELC